MITVKGIA